MRRSTAPYETLERFAKILSRLPSPELLLVLRQCFSEKVSYTRGFADDVYLPAIRTADLLENAAAFSMLVQVLSTMEPHNRQALWIAEALRRLISVLKQEIDIRDLLVLETIKVKGKMCFDFND